MVAIKRHLFVYGLSMEQVRIQSRSTIQEKDLHQPHFVYNARLNPGATS